MPVPTIEDDVDRYLHLEANRQTIVEEQEAIKARLRSQLGRGRHQLDTGVVTISPNHRFNAALAEPILGRGIAEGRLTPEQVKDCWKPASLDAAAVKKILPPDVYADCMKDAGTAKVSVS